MGLVERLKASLERGKEKKNNGDEGERRGTEKKSGVGTGSENVEVIPPSGAIMTIPSNNEDSFGPPSSPSGQVRLRLNTKEIDLAPQFDFRVLQLPIRGRRLPPELAERLGVPPDRPAFWEGNVSGLSLSAGMTFNLGSADASLTTERPVEVKEPLIQVFPDFSRSGEASAIVVFPGGPGAMIDIKNNEITQRWIGLEHRFGLSVLGLRREIRVPGVGGAQDSDVGALTIQTEGGSRFKLTRVNVEASINNGAREGPIGGVFFSQVIGPIGGFGRGGNGINFNGKELVFQARFGLGAGLLGGVRRGEPVGVFGGRVGLDLGVMWTSVSLEMKARELSTVSFGGNFGLRGLDEKTLGEWLGI